MRAWFLVCSFYSFVAPSFRQCNNILFFVLSLCECTFSLICVLFASVKCVWVPVCVCEREKEHFDLSDLLISNWEFVCFFPVALAIEKNNKRKPYNQANKCFVSGSINSNTRLTFSGRQNLLKNLYKNPSLVA